MAGINRWWCVGNEYTLTKENAFAIIAVDIVAMLDMTSDVFLDVIPRITGK
jgi:hypothetical protein